MEAASIRAKTYFNGESLGEHRGAFTAFCYELTQHLHFGGKIESKVQVDDSWQSNVPPISGDFNMDGGLYRPVHLITTNAVCISPLDLALPGVYLTTESALDSTAEIEVRTAISSNSAIANTVTIETMIRDVSDKTVATLKKEKQPAPAESLIVAATEFVANPHRWNGRKDPYVYLAKVRLYQNNELLDEVIRLLGIPMVAISQEKGFLPNNQLYPIHGVNRQSEAFANL